MCAGVENEILDLTAGTDRNRAVADHLDGVYHLFDRPLYSNVHTALYSLKDKFGAFAEDRYRELESFCVMHTKCGLFLRLRLEDNDDPTKEKDSIPGGGHRPG